MGEQVGQKTGEMIHLGTAMLEEIGRRGFGRRSSRWRRRRAVRRDALHHLKELDRAGEAQADEVHRAEERVQKLTDEHVKRIDDVLKAKEAEILEV